MAQVRLAERQMRGVYRYRRYRTLVESTSNATIDTERAREVLRQAARPTHVAEGTAADALAQAAAESVAADVAAIMEGPIDTTDALLWLRLRDAVVSATRLMMAPWLDCGLGVTVADLIVSVAETLDVVMRICDADRTRADLGDYAGTLRAASPIVVDLCCYRGCAWLGVIDDLGALACTLRDDAWLPRRDAYATGVLNAEAAAVRRALGCDAAASQQAWLAAMIDVVLAYDKAQFAHMRRTTGKIVFELDPALVAEALDADAVADLSGALVAPVPEGTDGMRGFCRTFTTRPLACVANVPVAFEERASTIIEGRRLLDVVARVDAHGL